MMYCYAETKINHETFSCDLTEHDDEESHVWRGGAWPPCTHCAGIDSHAENCPRPDDTISTTKMVEVSWGGPLEKPIIKAKII